MRALVRSPWRPRKPHHVDDHLQQLDRVTELGIDGHIGRCQIDDRIAFLALSRRSDSAPSGGAGHRIPLGERSGSEQAVVHRPQHVPTGAKQILDHAVNGRKALQMGG